MEKILRSTFSRTDIVIANGANLSNAFDMRDFALLVVTMPAAWTAASIGFKVSPTKSGTFVPLYDDDGTLIQIDSPTADNAYTAPAGIAAGHWVKLWSQNGSGSDTNQAAERTLTVSMKG